MIFHEANDIIKSQSHNINAEADINNLYYHFLPALNSQIVSIENSLGSSPHCHHFMMATIY